MGAGEAGGGKRGWWGQARRMGAASHRAKSRANTPPLAQGVPNKVNQPIRKGEREEKTNEGPESSKSQTSC